MSQHIIRDLPGKHAATKRALYPARVNVSQQRLRFLAIPLLSEKALQCVEQPHRGKRSFKPVEGQTWRWGVFECQVYEAIRAICENKSAIPAGKRFIIASGGKMQGEGAIQPFGFWKRLLGSSDFTHYEIVVDTSHGKNGTIPSFSRMYFSRGIIDGGMQ